MWRGVFYAPKEVFSKDWFQVIWSAKPGVESAQTR